MATYSGDFLKGDRPISQALSRFCLSDDQTKPAQLFLVAMWEALSKQYKLDFNSYFSSYYYTVTLVGNDLIIMPNLTFQYSSENRMYNVVTHLPPGICSRLREILKQYEERSEKERKN
jgi:hypothetical protein